MNQEIGILCWYIYFIVSQQVKWDSIGGLTVNLITSFSSWVLQMTDEPSTREVGLSESMNLIGW